MQEQQEHDALPSRRQPGLDTLRALAILLVFAYHYQVFVSRAPSFGWASEIGWVGVDLFFVLSGYLIANQIFGGLARGQVLSLPAFYGRRFLRTLPNYWVVLALYCLFPLAMGGREPPPLWRFLSFTQNIQLQPGTAFSHAWSLCIEEQFYLLLPLATVLGLRHVRSLRWAGAVLGGLMLAAIAWRAWLWTRFGREAGDAVQGYYPNVYYASLCRMDEFLPGVAVALLKHAHPQAWAGLLRRGQVVLTGALAACALLAWALLRGYYIDGYGYGFAMTAFGYSAIALAFAALLVAALSPRTLLHRLRVPGAAALAAWSYAIYLSHKPLAVIVQKPLAGLGIEAGSMPGIALITLPCLLGGWLLYRGVETPFMRLRQRWLPGNFSSARPMHSGANPPLTLSELP
ncbi:MAG: acyltransferase, partial [Burkholderiaceae bacterium]